MTVTVGLGVTVTVGVGVDVTVAVGATVGVEAAVGLVSEPHPTTVPRTAKRARIRNFFTIFLSSCSRSGGGPARHVRRSGSGWC